jgi:L-fucose mutarotase/ribose pyranase (RbsD/FucU family)
MVKKIVAVFIIMIGIISCSKPVKQQQNVEALAEVQDWKLEVEKTLKLFGHRNWIVIADGAYPQQSNQGIKTIAIDANQLEAVEFVNQLIEKANHVDANIFLDREMAFISEKEAKGIETYRTKLSKVLEGKPVIARLHEKIIQELDASAKLFNVLILKTDLAIPYTSVFFQLECGYWNAEAEKNLRIKLHEE